MGLQGGTLKLYRKWASNRIAGGRGGWSSLVIVSSSFDPGDDSPGYSAAAGGRERQGLQGFHFAFEFEFSNFEFESAQNQSCTPGGSPGQCVDWERLCDQHKPLLLQRVPHVWVQGEPAQAGPDDRVADGSSPVHQAVPLEVLEQGHDTVVVGLPLRQPHGSSVVGFII